MFEFSARFKIGKKAIGEGAPTYVIAEIGSNHDCSLDEAKRHIHRAAQVKVDAVKFQSFSAEGLLSRKRPAGLKAGEFKISPDTTWEVHPVYPMLERLTLPDEWHGELKKECERVGIEFLSAPFDVSKARLLKKTGLNAIKIASGELTNVSLLREVGAFGVPVLVSTGMAILSEVESALQILWDAGCRDVLLFHCVSTYPPSFSHMNLKTLSTLSRTFKCPVGISDHTHGFTVPLVSLALGSVCVEKHVTFDRRKSGPDHPFALEWDEFERMIQELRNAEAALGDGKKLPAPGEEPERVFARKGLYARRDLKAGEMLTSENTKLVRHAFGIGAPEIDEALGKKLLRDRAADEAVFWEDLSR